MKKPLTSLLHGLSLLKKVSHPSKNKRATRLFLFVSLFSITAPSALKAQMSMPSMPSVASPVIRSPVSPVITQTEDSQAQGNTETAKSAQSSEAENTALSKNLSASSLNDLNSLITDGTLSSLLEDGTGTNSMSSLLSVSNLISGKTDINNLLDQQGSTTALTASNTSLVILNKILEQLSSLSEEVELLRVQNSSLSQEPKSASSEYPDPEIKSVTDINRSGILRFTVNGYNVLDTCKTIYFSTPDEDGSFLCTADREYTANGLMRKETFYMLFSNNGKNSYHAAVRVMQDYLNEYSFVYQLSQRENIEAVKTGNLVSILIDEKEWKLDFLISLSD